MTWHPASSPPTADDEEWDSVSPEIRWQRMRDWVGKQIKESSDA